MQRFVRCLLPVLMFGLMLVGCDSGGGVSTSGLGDSTTVAFTETAGALGEAGGEQTLEMTVRDPGFDQIAFNLQVDRAQTDALLGEDVRGLPSDTVLTFPESATDGQTRSFSFEVVDDSVTDGDETVVMSLSAPDTSDLSIGERSTFTLSIQENDLLAVPFADTTLASMTAVSVASENDWGADTEGDPPNAPYATASGFGGNEPANDWLISPPLDFNAIENETLTFLNAKGFDDTERRGLQVKVSTDYDGTNTPENSTWATVPEEDINFSDGEFSFVHSGAVDLSADSLQSTETYVAFQYQSSGTDSGNAATWQVDEVVVTGTVANP